MIRKLLAAVLIWGLVAWPAVANDSPAWPSSGGGGGGFAGMNGSAGNEATLSALYGLRNLSAYPDAGPVYYLSSAAGGDYGTGAAANNCLTPATPCASLATLKSVLDDPNGSFVLKPGATVRFDCGETFNFETADELDFTSHEPPGSTDVILRLEGSRPGCKYTINANTQPGIAFVHAHSVNDLVNEAGGRIVFVGAHFTAFQRPIVVVDDGIDFGAVDMSAVMGDGPAEDFIRPAADSKAFCLNCRTTTVNNPSYTGQESGAATFIGLDEWFQSAPDATDNIAMVNPTIVTKAGAENHMRLTVIGHSFRVGAHAFDNKRVFSPQLAASTEISFYAARVVFQGAIETGGTCFFSNDSSAAINGLTWEVYESTFSNCDSLFIAGTGGTGTTSVPARVHRIRYSALQPGTSSVFAPASVFQINYAGAKTALWDITDNVVNNHSGGANFFRVRNDADSAYIAGNTAALFQTALNAASGTDPLAFAAYRTTVFPSATLSSGQTAEVTADLFANSGIRCVDTLGTGGAACVAGVSDAAGGTADGFCDESSTPESCARLIESPICVTSTANCATAPNSGLGADYTVPLAAPIWGLPGTATELTSLNLRATKYGAR